MKRPRPPGPRVVRRRPRWHSWAWMGGGLAVVGVVAALLISGSASSQGRPLPAPTVAGGVLVRGQAPPDFTATTFDGHQLTLSSYKGRPVLINFFASWCTQCAYELPLMERAYQQHKAGGFAIVGVNALETGDGPAFYHSFGLSFPAVYDPGNPGRIASAYGVTSSLPVSVFVDKSGRVDLIQLGALTSGLLEQEIQKLA